MFYPVHWVLSLLASVLRLGAGRGGVKPVTNEPVPTLYEFEACPWCRIAREAISEAGVSVLVRPCPKGGLRFRPHVQDIGGKSQFPYWVDGKTGIGMYESGAISKLMRTSYEGRRPFVHWLGPISSILSSYALLIRLGGGRSARPVKPQTEPLEFFGSEVNPAARLVKEELCALELEYIWHPGAGGGVRLLDRQDSEQIDGGKAVLAYLKSRYRA